MVMVKYNGNIFDFSSRAELSYGVTMKHELSCKMKHTGTMVVFLQLFLCRSTSILSLYGNYLRFHPSYEKRLLSYEKEISLEIALDTTNGIDGKGSLKTPFTEDIMVMVKYNGNIFDFSSRAELSYGVTMKHELSCKMKHTGTMNKFRSLTLFTYNRKTVSSDISLDITNGVEGNVDIRSPYKNMKAIVSHRMDGTLSNFRFDTNFSIYSIRCNYVDIKLRLMISYVDCSPQDVNIEYAINGHMKSFESTASAFIGDINGIKEATTLHLGDRVLNLDSTLTTMLV
jgi:hypothetical protein